MFKPDTFIIEMTGIFGAGYLPGLFQPLTELLRTKYVRVDNNGERSQIATRYHIDNTAAFHDDEPARTRAKQLLIKMNPPEALVANEVRELIGLLNASERRFLDDIESFKMPIDIIFRRGGRLQDYILFDRQRHLIDEIIRDPRSEPKLQFFLEADLDIIEQTYKDQYIRQMISENANVYNSTPEKAHQQQDEWLRRVEHFTGLKRIKREHPAMEKFAEQIAEEILEGLRYFGFGIQPKMKHVFISYVRENTSQVNALCHALTQRGVKVWRDRDEIDPGMFWKDAIRRAIQDGDFFIACFSEEYNNRVRAFMNEELILAIEVLRQHNRSRAWFIPVLFSGKVPDRDIGAGETLEALQWVELDEGNWDHGIKRILDVIQPMPAGG